MTRVMHHLVVPHEDKQALKAAAGRWLVEKRSLHGRLTAAEFARRLEITPSRLSSYERGVAGVDDDMAQRIADVLSLPILEVRRGLGLWVPEDQSDAAMIQSLAEMPDTTIKALIQDLPLDRQDTIMSAILADRSKGRRRAG